MRDHSDNGARSRRASALRWAERLLVVAGMAMLAWSALLVTDASLAQWKARRSLGPVSRAETSVAPRVVDASTPAPAPAPVIHRGAAIADLSIPRVDLSAVVLHGSDAQTLRRGPGHLEDTPLPGEAGNVVIAGHRDSFFRPLRDVRLGDDIFIDTPQARRHYRVTSLRVVNGHDLSVLEPTDEGTLTLITCYPFWVLGQAPDRFVVRATLVTDATPGALVARGPTSELTPVPSVGMPTAHEQAVVNDPVAHDDTTLVRHAIEQFRLTYNARLISHNDVRPAGPLRFQSCEVALADDRATATCTASSSQESEPSVWIAALERAGDGWAIRSIVAN